MHAHASSSGGADDASSATHARSEDDPQQSSAAAAAAVGEAQRLASELRLDPLRIPPPATPSAAPAASLHRHALECIFAFLGLCGLAMALRVSRDWQAAVRSMGSAQLTPPQPQRAAAAAALLRVMVASPLGRHVGSLGGYGNRLQLDDDALALLAGRMPQLRALICRLELRPPGEVEHQQSQEQQSPSPAPPLLSFPSCLRTLFVQFPDPTAAACANTALAAVGRLVLLESLTVELAALTPQISFAPLAAAALPQLRSFYLHGTTARDSFSDAQVEELRDMTQLRVALVDGATPALLRRLLRPPHSLQWQQISLPLPLDAAAAALLPQLPLLATLVSREIDCMRFDFLRGLRELTCVRLYFDESERWWRRVDPGDAEEEDQEEEEEEEEAQTPEAAAAAALVREAAESAAESASAARRALTLSSRVESLVSGLSQCARLEQLLLSDCDGLTSAHLAVLLPRLPRLRELDLESVGVDSLRFLSAEPAADTLTALSLRTCTRLPPDELRHVYGLRVLSNFSLWRSLSAPLDRDDPLLAPFRTPSARMPGLRAFRFQSV